MFLELGRVDSKVNRESRRIYNISGMPGGSGLIYSGCNRFPGFPIRRDGDSVHRAGQLDSRTISAATCKLIKPIATAPEPNANGDGCGVQAVDRTPRMPGSRGRKEPMQADTHPDAPDSFAAEGTSRSVAVIDYDED